MNRVLLVTNDFPPTVGGIQSYLRDFVGTLPPEHVVVFASTQDFEAARRYDAEASYKVIRWHRSLMVPTLATMARLKRVIRDECIDTVWFGAAAPNALMARAARRAGAMRIIASTHGHEVGWSMIPGAHLALRLIGNSVDVITYISNYTLGRTRTAIGGHPSYEQLPSGVDTFFFRPATEEQRAHTRARLDVGPNDPLIVCVSRLVPRKGQDQLIRVIDRIRESIPGATLVLVGQGPYRRQLEDLAGERLGDSVVMTGQVDRETMRDIVAAADVFAMPARTRGRGLDTEGLGIVYLEAQACGVPVVAGDSGGAPETVTRESGVVVDGRDADELARELLELLADEGRRKAMGAAGRAYTERAWTWEVMGARLRRVLGDEENV